MNIELWNKYVWVQTRSFLYEQQNDICSSRKYLNTNMSCVLVNITWFIPCHYYDRLIFKDFHYYHNYRGRKYLCICCWWNADLSLIILLQIHIQKIPGMLVVYIQAALICTFIAVWYRWKSYLGEHDVSTNISNHRPGSLIDFHGFSVKTKTTSKQLRLSYYWIFDLGI